MERIPPTETETAAFDPDWGRVKRIGKGPLSFLRRSLWWIRKTFFTRPRSKTDAVRVQMDKPALEEVLGRQYFEPGWETSYQYRNEICNYRRVEFDDEIQPGIKWWQVHIRGYPIPTTAGKAASTIELTAHFEPEPVEHPDAHVNKSLIDGERGMTSMQTALEEAGVSYEYVQSES